MKPVLILGAGINGAAVARDLAINGVPVWIVDTGDVAGGATSRSSRLIHGGLRYLEYRDTDLVRESLQERERLLRLAPQFVKPLQLMIPVSRRLGGLWAGALRFSGLARSSVGRWLLPRCGGPRGLIAVESGLSMYDRLAESDSLPPHETVSVSSLSSAHARHVAPEVNRERFRWLCSYWDAQLEFPERFVLALLEDARLAAEQNGQAFNVLPWHRAHRDHGSNAIMIEPVDLNDRAQTFDVPETRHSVEPSIIINATGAWGDLTLDSLGVDEHQLLAGTKGSHLFTSFPPIVQALGSQGIYAEAADGRLVFVLPCGAGVLIGTTDEPFSGDPADAVATEAEISYLLEMVNDVFPTVGLTREHVQMHHAGVRPLPNVESASSAAIPRGHSIHEGTLDDTPVLTLVGGKLTTCRALAEEVTERVLSQLHLERRESTLDRLVPGAGTSPVPLAEAEAVASRIRSLREQYRLSHEQAAAVWRLIGDRFDQVFDAEDSIRPSLSGTAIPLDFVRWSIRNEWCGRLEDLVERRLMLVLDSQVSMSTIRQIDREMVDAGKIGDDSSDRQIARVCQRLHNIYGIEVVSDDRSEDE